METESFLKWDNEAASHFPTLMIAMGIIRGVRVERTNQQIEALRSVVTEDVRQRFKLEELKNDQTVRAYRDLFWALGIDPTKIRPSGEALLRRILHGHEIPNISTVVDAYNLASARTVIPMSGLDFDRLALPLVVRFSRDGDEFQGIGITKPMRLDHRLLVVSDSKRVVCIYPHRDADATKVNNETQNVVVIGYGAPKINQGQLMDAVKTALDFIKQTSGGSIEGVSVFKPR